MTISTQWIAFGAIAIALFVTGLLWPKEDDCPTKERSDKQEEEHQSRPQHRHDEAALAGAER